MEEADETFYDTLNTAFHEVSDSTFKATFNCAGTHFILLSRSIVDIYPAHGLSTIIDRALAESKPLVFFVDRPLTCFAAILNFYQTGDLHLPDAACPFAFKEELRFWKIPRHLMGQCCSVKFNSLIDEAESMDAFQTYSNRLRITETEKGVNASRIGHVLRSMLWQIISYETPNIAAKVYRVFIALGMLATLAVLALQTLSSFKRDPTLCEVLDHMWQVGKHSTYRRTKEVFGMPDCGIPGGIGDETYVASNYTYGLDIPTIRVRVKALDLIEAGYVIFFSVDIFLRLFTAPNLKNYVTCVFNVLDMLALLAFFVHLYITNAYKEHRYNTEWVMGIAYLQAFRFLRLYRLVRLTRASRVLEYSLKQNLSDLTFVGLALFFVVITFSSLIYFIEDREHFPTIPKAAYWCIITITTVGYGDIFPTSGFGQVVACLLAMCGILFTATTVPLFVNNFLSLYSNASFCDNIHKAMALRERQIAEHPERRHNQPSR